MLSKRSLRGRFLLEIAVSMTAMLIFINIIIGYHISMSLYDTTKNELERQAEFIITTYPNQEEKFNKEFNHFDLSELYNDDIVLLSTKQQTGIKTIQRGTHYYIELITPYPMSKSYLKITRDVTNEKNFLYNIYYTMAILVIFGFIFILYCASMLSSQLLNPLHRLTGKFGNMDESILQPLDIKDFPLEFAQLGELVNRLITKIKTSINYRKELYVGTAHELRTPLAVMRLKNQITLMKYKKDDKIRETLQQNMDSIDILNNMIHNILEYGRAEGGQFEKPKRVNIIRFMAEKAEEYELLAHSQNRNFIYNFEVERFMISIQPLLFMQIFQNFIQNALKFTPKNGLVTLTVYTDDKNFIIEVKDEGCGIDETQDLFAPFKRSVESTGAGLGLFLAQNAAESMGVHLRLENRKDKSGAIASILFPFNRFLHNEM
ncbi:MAG TPA: HAMP domain-containing histidine kinase [Campylobacterales bacterium]|nr:HAMP domain-containing histidine kinase [Campylobacterales bacterium]HIP40932.1 HAMP domain-containing histidine kinase [Campylobacterales bacterium]